MVGAALTMVTLVATLVAAAAVVHVATATRARASCVRCSVVLHLVILLLPSALLILLVGVVAARHFAGGTAGVIGVIGVGMRVAVAGSAGVGAPGGGWVSRIVVTEFAALLVERSRVHPVSVVQLGEGFVSGRPALVAALLERNARSVVEFHAALVHHLHDLEAVLPVLRDGATGDGGGVRNGVRMNIEAAHVVQERQRDVALTFVACGADDLRVRHERGADSLLAHVSHKLQALLPALVLVHDLDAGVEADGIGADIGLVHLIHELKGLLPRRGADGGGVGDNVGFETFGLHLGEQFVNEVVLAGVTACLDGGVVSDNVRFHPGGFHLLEKFENDTPLLRRSAHRNSAVVRNHIRVEALGLHILQQVECDLPTATGGHGADDGIVRDDIRGDVGVSLHLFPEVQRALPLARERASGNGAVISDNVGIPNTK